jgi:hypothetical protein
MAAVALAAAQLFSYSLSFWRTTSCECHCSGEPSERVLALLGEQLARCGPENLARSCPPAAPAQWFPGVTVALLLFAAGFIAGAAAASLGHSRSSPPEPPSRRASLALPAAEDFEERRGPVTPSAKRALAA